MAAVAAACMQTVSSPLEVASNIVARSTPSSASCSTSLPGVKFVARRNSRRLFTNRQPASFRFPSRMGGSEDMSTAVVAVQSSNTVRELQTEKLIPETASLLTMTYLEGGSWIIVVLGVRILVDPVLVGDLDFGIPWLYGGGKKIYKDFKLEDLQEVDYLLITQGLDDHCHENTLRPLSLLRPNLPVIGPPSARSILSKYFKNVTYLDCSGESTTIKGRNGSEVVVRASPGAVVGPPWQKPENGYFIEAKEPKFTLYFEPHCAFSNANLENDRADVIVTPVIKQVLPGYTLVSGQEDAVKIAELLKAKFVVTMKNGDLNARGALSKLVWTQGTTESFQELLAKKLPEVQVLNPVPGVSLEIPVGE